MVIKTLPMILAQPLGGSLEEVPVIQGMFDSLSASDGGGTVQLAKGAFTFASGTLNVPARCALRAGPGTTINITHGSIGITIGTPGVDAPASLYDLDVVANVASSSDAISTADTASTGGGPRGGEFRNVRVSNVGSDAWGITIQNISEMRFDHLMVNTAKTVPGNGIRYINNSLMPGAENFGECEFSKAIVWLYGTAGVGLAISGYGALYSKSSGTSITNNQNDLLFTNLTIVGNAVNRANLTGVYLDGAQRICFLRSDFEQLYTPVVETQTGGASTHDNSFIHCSSWGTTVGPTFGTVSRPLVLGGNTDGGLGFGDLQSFPLRGGKIMALTNGQAPYIMKNVQVPISLAYKGLNPYTSDATPTQIEADNVITNKGATGPITVYLPPSWTIKNGSFGFWIVCIEPYPITIKTFNNTLLHDFVRGPAGITTESTGAYVSPAASAPGDAIYIQNFGQDSTSAPEHGYWLVLSQVGTWTVT